MHRNTLLTIAMLALVLGFSAYVLVHQAVALPGGSSIVYNATAGTPSVAAGSRNDSRGTITTVVLSTVQQDTNWKAYVGNITGRLSLDDGSGYTIYDWPLSTSKDGKVFISRYSSLTFTSVNCSNTINVSHEELYYGMIPTQSDNINKTFNATSHQQFAVNGVTIPANTCKSTATYRNDTAQFLNGNQYFGEVILQDSSDRLMYVSMINASTSGFDNNPYDFQVLVPESTSNASTTYYFFTEIGN